MLNPIEEAKHAKLREMCRELRVPPPPEIHIGLKVMDRNGVLVFDDKQRGHSWTRNYHNIKFAFEAWASGTSTSFGAGHLSGKNTSGTVRGGATYVLTPTQVGAGGYAAAGGGVVNTGNNVDYGILVGTSDSAFSVEHNAMQALIAHGNAPGQLFYQAMAEGVKSYNSELKTWKQTHKRVFNNNSGGSITVKEVGLVFNLWLFAYSNLEGFLVERSVLDPTVPVANGAQLTVTYEISMDFSAID